MSDAAKRAVAIEILDRALLNIHLDPRRPGVVVPQHLSHQPSLILVVGHPGPRLRVPIPDLVVDGAGIRATLSFGGVPFACAVPWSAVFGLVDETGKGRLFEEDVPADLPPVQRTHEDECSFCLALRADVKFLVAAERASICDRCVAAHRPRGFVENLRAFFAPRAPSARGSLVAMPYRGAATNACDFCKQSVAPLIVGLRARICRPCLKLADEVVKEQ